MIPRALCLCYGNYIDCDIDNMAFLTLPMLVLTLRSLYLVYPKIPSSE